jgi:hypothetical protein
LVPSGELDQLYTMVVEVVVLAELLQGHANIGRTGIRIQRG